MDYTTQLTRWQEALDAAEENIRIARQMKTTGAAILYTIEIDRATKKLAKDIEAKDLAALMHSATQAIAQGTKLEAEARRQRGDLLADKPLKKSWE